MFGSFFVLNLLLAVLESSYNEQEEKMKEEEAARKEEKAKVKAELKGRSRNYTFTLLRSCTPALMRSCARTLTHSPEPLHYNTALAHQPTSHHPTTSLLHPSQPHAKRRRSHVSPRPTQPSKLRR